MSYEEDQLMKNDVCNSQILNFEENMPENEKIHSDNNNEQNILYANSLEIMSNYLFLIKISNLEYFYKDSLIKNCIIRLFRKSIQLLTNEYLNNIHYKDRLINIKEFSMTFKVNISKHFTN